MKANFNTLLQSTPGNLHLQSSFAILLAFCLVLFTGQISAHPDDWPEMYFQSEIDLSGSEIIQGEESIYFLACKTSIQVSLNQAGEALITPGMLVTAPAYPLNQYSVDIMGPLTNVVYCDNIGEELMAAVTEIPTGNVCMTMLTVEDKLDPLLVCEDDTIPCNANIATLDFLSFLELVDDNCDPDPDVWYSYTVTPLDCDPDGFAAIIEVIYTATDEYGNSSTCEQTIFMEKQALEDVVFPDDVELSCVDADTDPENTGEPTVFGEPIHHFCELISWYSDMRVDMCDGQYKIVRTWNVMDWCTGMTITDMQVILVIDTIPPELNCPNDLTIGTLPWDCFAVYSLPQPDATDLCSDDNLIDYVITVNTVPGLFQPGQSVELELGMHIITFRATDDCGNSAECTYKVTVIDDDLPVLACNSINVTLNPLMGMAFVNVDSLDVDAFDNCGIDTLLIRRMENNCGVPEDLQFGQTVKFCCEDVGETIMVVIKAIDVNGNMSICMIQVNVIDDVPPVAMCQDIMAFLGPDGMVTIDPDDVDDGSTDNCEVVDITVDPDTFDCDDIGFNVVTLTVSDASGNTATCTALVQVKDTIPPDAICQDITVMLGDDGMVVITAAEIGSESFDNCGIDTMVLSQDTLDCDDVGTVMIILTVTDLGGNTSTCEAEVMVADNPPTVICMDATVYLDESGTVIVTPDDVDFAADDCSMPVREVIPNNFDCDDIGDNIVVLIATDNFGNTASCTAIVTVVDSLAPECLTTDITVYLDDNGEVSIEGDAVDDGSSDNCAIDTITVDPSEFTCDSIGVNVVTQTVTDVNGNSSTCTANVTVADTTAPVCQTMDITVFLDENGDASIDDEAVDDGSSDNCEIQDISIDINDFDCDDVGVVIIVQTVTDVNGNSSTCTASITVQDTISPVCLTSDITVFLDEDGLVSIDSNAVDNGSADNCEVLEISVDPGDFDCDDAGIVVVTQTVTDVNGNSTTCTANVTIADTTAPVCQTMDITVFLDENGEVNIAGNAVDDGSSDNCDILEISVDPAGFTCDDIGVVVVIQTVTDVNGNSATCTANVTVQDTTAPVCQTMDITVFLDEEGLVSIDSNAVDNGSSDNCEISEITVDPADFDCDDAGTVIVTQTVTDINGNTATCTASVTVQDTISPLCQTMDITVYLDENGMVNLEGDAVDDGSSDNCAVMDITIDPATFDCDDTGIVVVTQTVTDENGNSSTCTANITVADTTAPVCQTMDITVFLDENGEVVVDGNAVDNGSSDNCAVDTIMLDDSEFTCEDLGMVVVTQTVTDVNGNTSTCTAIITVQDSTAPVCQAMDITVFLDENGEVNLLGDAVDDGSSDNCAVEEITVDPGEFDCDDVGVVVVTQTVTDVNGNSSTCTASVTVLDTVAPICSTMDITVQLDPNGIFVLDSNAVDNGSMDACTIAEIAIDPDTVTCDEVGFLVVTQTVTDINGNTATCTATVTIQNSEEPEATCQDITVFLDETGNVSIEAADIDGGSFTNCGELILEADPTEFDCDDVGPNVVTLTVSDLSGNSSTCTATVTVMDTLAPLCQTMDLTVYLDENGMVAIDSNAVDDGSTDNCDIVEISVDPDAFDCDDLGPVVVTQTVTDENGNSSTCTATVTVADTISPICVAMDITVTLNGDGMITIEGEDVDGGSSDNCAVNLEVTPNFFDCDDLGNNEVVLTVTDDAGNSSTCTANVTVEDEGTLQAFCQNLIVFLDENGMVSITPEIVNNGSGGGCAGGEVTLELDETDFDCDDIGPNVVVLTVTDQMDNTATCSAIITVVDNIPPSITCPVNVTVECENFNPNNLGQFGNATGDDNCPGFQIVVNNQVNVDECGLGTVTRTFTITDASGNTANCVQTIFVVNTDPFDESNITWPPSLINLPECSSTAPGNIPNSQPVINFNSSCAAVGVTFEDSIVMTCDMLPSPPCVQVFRTWIVVDTCQLEPGTQNGIFTFDQKINVNDNTGPIFGPESDITVTAMAPQCNAMVNLEVSATACGMGVTDITNDFNAGGANASGIYPIGTTVVTFIATDDCCNTSTLEVTVVVEDPGDAMFQCEKLIVFMSKALEVTLSASDFITFTPGSCTNIDDFFFSYSNMDPFDSLRTFECSFAGNVTSFTVYIYNSSLELIETCLADLDFRDPENLCGQIIISGEITSENFTAMSQVPVFLFSGEMETGATNADGLYIFEDLQEERSYTVLPFKNNEMKKGVSTLDLVVIQKHLLGVKPLGSPYKYIAADANASGEVSALDIVEIRKVILGINTEFTNNSSYRFIDASYTFPDPDNPFMQEFPESVFIESLVEGLTNIDFIGVKIGDVNNPSIDGGDPFDIDGRSSERFNLFVTDQKLHPGNRYTVPVTIEKFEAINGYQFLINIDQDFARVENVILPEGGLMDLSNIGLNTYADGSVGVSWHSHVATDREPETVLFSLELLATGEGRLSDLMVMARDELNPEAYRGKEDLTIVPVGLKFRDAIQTAGQFTVFESRPNPFRHQTSVPIYMPEAGRLELKVHNIQGGLVKERSLEVSRGYHELILTENDLGGEGMYYLSIGNGDRVETTKIILIR